jgi:hypothetical protein
MNEGIPTVLAVAAFLFGVVQWRSQRRSELETRTIKRLSVLAVGTVALNLLLGGCNEETKDEPTLLCYGPGTECRAVVADECYGGERQVESCSQVHAFPVCEERSAGGCSCLTEWATSRPSSIACAAEEELGCCAEADYPDSVVAACWCSPYQPAGACASGPDANLASNVDCQCGYGFTAGERGTVASCTSTDGPCCRNGDSCVCYNDRSTCPAGTQTDTCTPPPSKPVDCATGDVRVPACLASASTGGTGGAGGTSGAGSGGSSGSASGLCTPKGGECEDTGDCACSEACLRTSDCESCSSYCVFPCETDQDCIDWSKNLTSEYTTCHAGSLFGYCQ